MGFLGLFFFLFAAYASAADQLNAWEKIPCVDAATWDRYKLEFKIKEFNSAIHWDKAAEKVSDEAPPAGVSPLCNDSFLATRLSKVLKVAEQLQIATPSSWPAHMRSALGKPYQYIKDATDSLAFSATLDAVGHNTDRQILLGSSVMTVEPYQLLKTLIHEARHSSPNDKSDLTRPGHVRCRHPDPKTSGVNGVCDEWLRFDENAGAYSLNVAFLLGLAYYAPDLTPGFRRVLEDEALMWLSTSFNNLPANLAASFEVLGVLGVNDLITVVHPFTYAAAMAPSNYHGKNFNHLANGASEGIFLFDESGVNRWIKTDGKIAGIYSHMRTPFPKSRDMAWLAFAKGGALTSYDWSKSGEKVSGQNVQLATPSPLRGREPQAGAGINIYRKTFLTYDKQLINEDGGKYPVTIPAEIDATSVVSAPALGTIILDSKGVAFLAFLDSDTFTRSKFQDPEGLGWISLSSGTYRDVLYGVNKSGKAFVSQYSEEDRDFKLAPFSKFIPIPTIGALKVEDGNNGFAYLATDSSVYVTSHGKIDWNKIKTPLKPKDVVWFQRNRAFGMLELQTMSPGELAWVQKCRVEHVIREPWIGYQVGINESKQLVFQDAAGACNAVDLTTRFPAVAKNQITDLKIGAASTGKAFLAAQLEITLSNGEVIEIPPYSL